MKKPHLPLGASRFIIASNEAPGNPDHGQYAPVAPPFYWAGDTLRDGCRAAVAYTDKWNLGAGNWPTPIAYGQDGIAIGVMSYNTRIWPLTDWTENTKPLFDPFNSINPGKPPGL